MTAPEDMTVGKAEILIKQHERSIGKLRDWIAEATADPAARRFGLTPAEARIAAYILTPKSAAQIAAELHLQPSTVKTYLVRIFSKVGVHSRAAARDALAGVR